MAARIGHGTVKTTMEVYARASNSADHEAATLLQHRFAEAFEESSQTSPGVTQNVTHRAGKPGPTRARTVTGGPPRQPPEEGVCEWG